MLLNITFIVENEILDVFTKKMRAEYIPNMQIRNVLKHPKLHRLITTDAGNENSTNYALQFFSQDPEELTYFLSKYGNIITNEFLSLFQNKVLAVFSIMLEEDLEP